MQFVTDLEEFLVSMAPLLLVAGGVIVAILIVLVLTATAVRAFR